MFTTKGFVAAWCAMASFAVAVESRADPLDAGSCSSIRSELTRLNKEAGALVVDRWKVDEKKLEELERQIRRLEQAETACEAQQDQLDSQMGDPRCVPNGADTCGRTVEAYCRDKERHLQRSENWALRRNEALAPGLRQSLEECRAEFRKVRQAEEAREATYRAKQSAAAAAKADSESQLKEALERKDYVQCAFSVARCHSSSTRAAALKAIRQERARSKVGGVVDLSLLHENQNTYAEEGDRLKELESGMAERGLKPLSCKSPFVQAVFECFADEDSDACTEDRVRSVMMVMKHLQL